MSIQAAISFCRESSCLYLTQRALRLQKNRISFEERYFGVRELKATIENRIWKVVDYLIETVGATEILAALISSLALGTLMSETDRIPIKTSALKEYLERYKPIVTHSILLDYADCWAFQLDFFQQLLSQASNMEIAQLRFVLKNDSFLMDKSDFLLSVV